MTRRIFAFIVTLIARLRIIFDRLSDRLLPFLDRFLGCSLPLFRVRGILLTIHFTFFLLLAYVGYEGWKLGAWEAAVIQTLVFLAAFTCVVLHEFGHSFTAMAFGVGVRRILLMPIGGMAEFESIPREPRRELLITLAGPAVNFLIAGILLLFVDLPGGWSLSPEIEDSWAGFLQTMIYFNVWMGLFNLVPAFPMDGGRILRATLASFRPYPRATLLAATVGKILALSAIVFALTVPERPAYLVAFLFCFIVIAGELEYRAVMRAERDEAHWRVTLPRFYVDPLPVEPVLRR